MGKLLDNDENIEVIYTRKNDTFIELHERGTIAQNSKADLFVSIHCDAFGNSVVNGAGTFVLGLHENDRNFEIAKKENSVILLEDNYKEKYDGFGSYFQYCSWPGTGGYRFKLCLALWLYTAAAADINSDAGSGYRKQQSNSCLCDISVKHRVFSCHDIDVA